MALGELRRKGLAVTAILNLYDDEEFRKASAQLAAEGIEARHLKSVEMLPDLVPAVRVAMSTVPSGRHDHADDSEPRWLTEDSLDGPPAPQDAGRLPGHRHQSGADHDAGRQPGVLPDRGLLPGQLPRAAAIHLRPVRHRRGVDRPDLDRRGQGAGGAVRRSLGHRHPAGHQQVRGVPRGRWQSLSFLINLRTDRDWSGGRPTSSLGTAR